MAIEGELVVRVDWDAGQVKRADARSRRPRVSANLLAGRSPEQAVALVSSLYAICGRSQGVAAAAATQAALARESSPALDAARERRIVAETLQEHFWRVLIDWPSLASRDSQVAAMGAVRMALAPWLQADDSEAARPLPEIAVAARQFVFGCDAVDWVAMAALDELQAWWRAGDTPVACIAAEFLRDDPALGTSDVGLLAPMDDALLENVLEPAIRVRADFDALPDWQGEPRETGALARTQSHPLVAAASARWGHGVGARTVARLVELAQLVRIIAGDAPSSARHGARRVGEGGAVAWVETARGLLVHSTQVRDGRIADYRVVAPTEWNFHPRGAFVRGVLGLSPATPQELRAQASRIVASLDPCVAWRVEVGHA